MENQYQSYSLKIPIVNKQFFETNIQEIISEWVMNVQIYSPVNEDNVDWYKYLESSNKLIYF